MVEVICCTVEIIRESVFAHFACYGVPKCNKLIRNNGNLLQPLVHHVFSLDGVFLLKQTRCVLAPSSHCVKGVWQKVENSNMGS